MIWYDNKQIAGAIDMLQDFQSNSDIAETVMVMAMGGQT